MIKLNIVHHVEAKFFALILEQEQYMVIRANYGDNTGVTVEAAEEMVRTYMNGFVDGFNNVGRLIPRAGGSSMVQVFETKKQEVDPAIEPNPIKLVRDETAPQPVKKVRKTRPQREMKRFFVGVSYSWYKGRQADLDTLRAAGIKSTQVFDTKEEADAHAAMVLEKTNIKLHQTPCY